MCGGEAKRRLMSLHDAQINNHGCRGDDVLISITKWDETPLRLRCKDVVLWKEVIADALGELVECGESDLLREAKQRVVALHYPEGYEEQLRHFRLLDDTNCPVLDVICRELVEEEPG